MQEFIRERLQEAVSVKKQILKDAQVLEQISSVTEQLWNVIAKDHSIYFCGNGGSAADAQHLATELSGRFLENRRAIKSEALGTNMAFTTAVGNDFSFDRIFARSLEALGRPGDALVLLSTSGNSANVLKAAVQAKKMNVLTICLTGASGEALADLCDFSIKVPSLSVPRIQEAHMLLGHIICEHLEHSLITLKPDISYESS